MLKGGLLEEHKGYFRTSSAQKHFSDFLASLVAPAIETTWLVAVGIRWKRPADCKSVNDLVPCVQHLGKTMLVEKALTLPEAVSIESIKHSLHSFHRAGLVNKLGGIQTPDFDSIIRTIAGLRPSGSIDFKADHSFGSADFKNMSTAGARL
jgi:hypothetical protein